MWWVVNAKPRPFYARKWSGTICIGGCLDTGPVWTGARNIAFTGIPSPDHLARSESLYRLSNSQNTLLLKFIGFPGNQSGLVWSGLLRYVHTRVRTYNPQQLFSDTLNCVCVGGGLSGRFYSKNILDSKLKLEIGSILKQAVMFSLLIPVQLGVFAKKYETRLRASLAPSSMCPHGTTLLPLEEFSLNLIYEYFSKIFKQNSSFIKICQVQQVLYRKSIWIF